MKFNPKNATLTALMIGISIVGPMVAYAGVSVVYPGSQNTVNVNTAPPITLKKGEDYTKAANVSFLTLWAGANNNGSFSITVSGLSGGNVTIDKYLNVSKDSSSVTSYKAQISAALSVGLTNPDVLKLRLWTGSTAPTNDASTGVCAVLNLEDAVSTESTNTCTASADVQLILELPVASSGSSTVSIRPSSVVFA